jgi:RNA polymerase sigma-70 factor (ECF subfamily)
MDEQQERVVVQGLREGKAEAWQALYVAYAGRVWRSVARLLGPQSADVADVVQETLMAAAHSAATFDPARGHLWYWLWGIARRKVALHFRKQERHDRLRQAGTWLAAGDGPLLRWLDGQGPTPAGAVDAAELATLVRATLMELPNDYERLLTAFYLDGDTVAAIALRERASEAAVRSKLARARQAFRAAFRKYADYCPDRPAEAHHESS